VHEQMERVVCSHLPQAGNADEWDRCPTKLLWTRVQGGIIRSLRMTSLAELVEFSRRNERIPEPQVEVEGATVQLPIIAV
jgi:DNA-binding IscR family transcriptional regulator